MMQVEITAMNRNKLHKLHTYKHLAFPFDIIRVKLKVKQKEMPFGNPNFNTDCLFSNSQQRSYLKTSIFFPRPVFNSKGRPPE